MNKVRSPVAGLAVSAVAILLCIAAVELILERYRPASPYEWDKRLMFFSEGQVFRNTNWGGFVYEPKSHIHVQAFYITDPKRAAVVDEYSYWVRTNSSGLVQSEDIVPSKPAIIFLGDSYTEGQGASPWFYDMQQRWKTSRYQIINGGILNTGFAAWQKLFANLPIATKDKKVVVIFISDDWIRPVRNIAERDLECIRSPDQCNGTNDFMGLPEDAGKAGLEIRRIARERLEHRGGLADLWRSSAIYQMLWRPAFFGLLPFSRENTQFAKSTLAIESLADAVGKENMLLIQLPQKDELLTGVKNRLAKRGLEFIKDNNYRFVDGLQKCHLTLADFHLRDGHPNSVGYGKILDCVNRSVRDAFRIF